MTIILRGRNEFYEGWLAGIFNQLAPTDVAGLDGYNMAVETGPEAALAILPSIEQGHVTVEVEA